MSGCYSSIFAYNQHHIELLRFTVGDPSLKPTLCSTHKAIRLQYIHNQGKNDENKMTMKNYINRKKKKPKKINKLSTVFCFFFPVFISL